LTGRVLFRQVHNGASGRLNIAAESFGSFRGVALLTVTTAQGTATRRVLRD
jgi:hypothetical protein